jgi:hypothetical protein
MAKRSTSGTTSNISTINMPAKSTPAPEEKELTSALKDLKNTVEALPKEYDHLLHPGKHYRDSTSHVDVAGSAVGSDNWRFCGESGAEGGAVAVAIKVVCLPFGSPLFVMLSTSKHCHIYDYGTACRPSTLRFDSGRAPSG